MVNLNDLFKSIIQGYKTYKLNGITILELNETTKVKRVLIDIELPACVNSLTGEMESNFDTDIIRDKSDILTKDIDECNEKPNDFGLIPKSHGHFTHSGTIKSMFQSTGKEINKHIASAEYDPKENVIKMVTKRSIKAGESVYPHDFELERIKDNDILKESKRNIKKSESRLRKKYKRK